MALATPFVAHTTLPPESQALHKALALLPCSFTGWVLHCQLTVLEASL